MSYNTSFTRRKSGYLHDLDCRTTGATKTALTPGETVTYAAVYTSDEAIEQGECIAMVRVPRGFCVTDMLLTFTQNGADAVVGVGDPYACGRFLGPIQLNVASGNFATGSPQGTYSCTFITRLQKIGRSGDGCGFGYTYTCETDLLITNGYGNAGFGVGGSSSASTTMSAGGYPGVIASGQTFGLSVTGFINPTIASQA